MSTDNDNSQNNQDNADVKKSADNLFTATTILNSTIDSSGGLLEGSGKLDGIFGDMDLGAFGEFLQKFMEFFDKLGIFNLDEFVEDAPFQTLGSDLAEAGRQENSQEAIQETLDKFVEEHAESLNISDAEKAEINSFVQQRLDNMSADGMNWAAVTREIENILNDDIAKVEADGIEYGEPVGVDDVEFHDDIVATYKMNANGDFDVVGVISVEDLKAELGDDFSVEIVKSETEDLAAGEDVVENQGYYVSDGQGNGYYLDANALDLAEVAPELATQMDAVPETQPDMSAPGAELDNKLTVSAPAMDAG